MNLTFNRTSMELKHLSRCRQCHIPEGFPFNRTSMELKLALSFGANTISNLLIEPVWN